MSGRHLGLGLLGGALLALAQPYALCRGCVDITVPLGQVRDTLRVVPGDGIVSGLLVHSDTAWFTVYSLPCPAENHGPVAIDSSRYQVDIVATDRDTVVREIIQSSSGSADTADYDRASVAPRWRVSHWGNLITRYEVRNGRALWWLGGGSGVYDSLALPLSKPAFLDGSQGLLVQGLTVLDRPHRPIRLSFFGIRGMGSSELATYELMAEVRGSERVSVPGMGTRNAWVVKVGSSVSDLTYWIDTTTRKVLMWEASESEGMCPRRSVRSGW